MSDGQAILAAVLADPADDLPRWAMADWLDEQGEAMRAEFIRVQLRLAELEAIRGPAMPENTQQGRRLLWNLRKRELELEAMPLAQWERHCRILVRRATEDPGWSWSCKRGFPHSVTCTLAAWMEHGPALVRTHPLERVALSCRMPTRDMFGLWEDRVHDHDDPRSRWGWASRSGLGSDNLAWGLPDGLFACLPPMPLLASFGWWACGSEQEALDALSAACLGWAKGAAETLSRPAAPPA